MADVEPRAGEERAGDQPLAQGEARAGDLHGGADRQAGEEAIGRGAQEGLQRVEAPDRRREDRPGGRRSGAMSPATSPATSATSPVSRRSVAWRIGGVPTRP